MPNSRPASRAQSADSHRKSHKRRHKDKSRSGTQTPKGARSGHATDNENEAGPSTLPNHSADEKATFTEEDFIALPPIDPEDPEEEVPETKSPVREWDRGKGKSRDYDGYGRKRKLDEVDLSDGYANKKQRVDAASRRAPWAADVDWEHCNNVAELYVASLSSMSIVFIRSQVAAGSGSLRAIYLSDGSGRGNSVTCRTSHFQRCHRCLS